MQPGKKTKQKHAFPFPLTKIKYGMKCNESFAVKKFTEVQEIHEH